MGGGTGSGERCRITSHLSTLLLSGPADRCTSDCELARSEKWAVVVDLVILCPAKKLNLARVRSTGLLPLVTAATMTSLPQLYRSTLRQLARNVRLTLPCALRLPAGRNWLTLALHFLLGSRSTRGQEGHRAFLGICGYCSRAAAASRRARAKRAGSRRTSTIWSSFSDPGEFTR